MNDENKLLEAKAITDELRSILADAARALALACSRSGQLDSAALDRQQVPSYELAWATAELLAAEQVVDAALSQSLELNRRVALVYVAEAIVLVRDRLELILLELDRPALVLQSLCNGPRVREFRRQFLASEFLHETARQIARNPEQLASVRFSDELTMVHDTFTRFASEIVAPLAESIHRHDLTVPEESILQPLREMGVFGLSIPTQYGGSASAGGDETATMLVATETLSEASLAAAGSLITRPEILSRALMTGGTEAQRQHWLPRLAAGEPLCGIAITEPDYGSDVASLSLRGSRCEGGWLLNGAKTWCTFAGKAGVLMVVTRTDPDKSKGYRGLSLLLAEKPSFDGHEFNYEQAGGGRLVGKAIPTIGYRGMHSFDLAFENFFVPDANVIGGEAGVGKGFYFTMAGMMGGRMQTAARACGVMRGALLAGLQYAQERKVFGEALLAYPLTGAKLSKMAARYTASRYLAYSIAPLIDQGEGRMEASLVKLFACRSAELLTRESLQIHGGMGYAEEMPISRYFVDARVLSIFEGAEETLALKVIARSLLESALEKNVA